MQHKGFCDWQTASRRGYIFVQMVLVGVWAVTSHPPGPPRTPKKRWCELLVEEHFNFLQVT